MEPNEEVKVEQSVESDGSYIVLEPKGEPKTTLLEAIAAFNEEHYNKTFAGRHPELGKMINCQVCSLRHRSSQPCEQKFAVGTHDPRPEGEKIELRCENAHPGGPTRNDVFGNQAKGKRRNPHYSARKRALVQLTRDIFHEDFEPYFNDHVASMKSARGIAMGKLRRDRHVEAASLRRQQDVSRRINCGLLAGSAR